MQKKGDGYIECITQKNAEDNCIFKQLQRLSRGQACYLASNIARDAALEARDAALEARDAALEEVK